MRGRSAACALGVRPILALVALAAALALTSAETDPTMTPSQAGPTPSTGQPAATVTTNNKTEGLEVMWSITDPATFEVLAVKKLLSTADPDLDLEDIVVTKISYPLEFTLVLSALVSNTTVQDAVAMTLDVAPISVQVQVTNDTSAVKAEVTVYSAKAFIDAGDISKMMYIEATPKTLSDKVLLISTRIPGAVVTEVKRPKMLVDATMVLRGTSAGVTKAMTLFGPAGRSTTALALSLGLLQAGIGGLFTIQSARLTPPILITNEVLVPVTVYPGAPPAPATAPANGTYYAPPAATPDQTASSATRLGWTVGSQMAAAVAVAAAALLVA